MAVDQNKNDKNLILDDERDILLDHDYDGIQELDNAMPPWWLYGFYITIAFSVVYLLYYEVTGWGPDQHEEYEREVAMAAERFGTVDEGETIDFSTVAVLTDDESIAAGRAIYAATTNLCQTCHGAEGQGLVGPNLTDNFWKHGCDLESVVNSIRVGFPDRGMPAYGSTVRIQDEQLLQLASFIMSIRGTNPPNPKAPNMDRAVECVE